MNEITIFSNPQFGEIRTAGTADVPLFCAVDIARALGYARPADAITAHCKKAKFLTIPTKGGPQKIKFIKESDMYMLIFRSNTPNAEQFTSWVTEEVLPTIRRQGMYISSTINENYISYEKNTTF